MPHRLVETPTLNALTPTSAWVYNLSVVQKSTQEFGPLQSGSPLQAGFGVALLGNLGCVLQCGLFGFTRFSHHGS
jgi:hypothetical protein